MFWMSQFQLVHRLATLLELFCDYYYFRKKLAMTTFTFFNHNHHSILHHITYSVKQEHI
jgi:hypothetical protein